MISFPVTVSCDNDKCPDEATTQARFEGALSSGNADQSRVLKLVGALEALPRSWIEVNWFGLQHVFCSKRCAEASDRPGR